MSKALHVLAPSPFYATSLFFTGFCLFSRSSVFNAVGKAITDGADRLLTSLLAILKKTKGEHSFKHVSLDKNVRVTQSRELTVSDGKLSDLRV